MLHAIAIDDEPMAIEILKAHSKQIIGVIIDAYCTDVKSAEVWLKTNSPDLVFLDIQMPGISGLEFARSLKQGTQVIFVTAHANYAIDGFDLAATDFILKPISLERFRRACDQAIQRASLASQSQHIFVKDGHRLVRIELNDLLFLKAEDNYLGFVEQKRYTLSRMKMNEVLEHLPTNFFRVHKSYIINLDKIERFEAEQVIINGNALPVSRAMIQSLKERLNFRR